MTPIPLLLCSSLFFARCTSKDRTVFELILDAGRAGWSAQPLPAKRGRKGDQSLVPAPYDPLDADSKKIWYYKTTTQTIPARYLRLLLAGHAVVPHGADDGVYKALAGEHVRRPLAIEDDTGGLAGRPAKRARRGAGPAKRARRAAAAPPLEDAAVDPLPLEDSGVLEIADSVTVFYVRCIMSPSRGDRRSAR